MIIQIVLKFVGRSQERIAKELAISISPKFTTIWYVQIVVTMLNKTVMFEGEENPLIHDKRVIVYKWHN